MLRIMLVLLTYFLLLSSYSFANEKSDFKQIKSIIIQKEAVDVTGRRIPYRIIIGPFISGDYALATIQFIEGASQIVLRKKNRTWYIVAGGGGAFDEESLSTLAGVPKKEAKNIIEQQNKYWQKRRKDLK